jgi:phage terminase large subunit-like protein
MHYIPRFNLNNQTKQKLVENKYNIPLTLNKKRNILENNSFKTIITITHEKLSHLCFNNEEENSNETYIRTAVTQRNKHKFITLVYFSPNK